MIVLSFNLLQSIVQNEHWTNCWKMTKKSHILPLLRAKRVRMLFKIKSLIFSIFSQKRLGNKCHKVKAKMPLWKVVSGRKTDDSKRSRRAQSLSRMDSASSLFLLFKLFLGKVFRTMTITKGLWGRRWIKKFEIGSPLMRNFFFLFSSFFFSFSSEELLLLG